MKPSILRRYLSTSQTKPRTLFDKLWDEHLVAPSLIYIDRHLVHEVTSPQAFEGLQIAGRSVRRPNRTLVTPDHNVSTSSKRLTEPIKDPASRQQVETLSANAKRFNLPNFFPLTDKRQGIVHIVGPEQGFSLPGTTIVCGDSHTSTHGAFGALAFGIGTSEVEHVLATQTLIQHRAKNLLINVTGKLPVGVSSKDLVLHVIGEIGTAGGTGYVMEFAGEWITSLSMEGRMTVCNMAIEAGARAGIVAPDSTTYNYLKGRPMAPRGADFDRAVEYWETLKTDPGATFDKVVEIDARKVAPQVTWGTNPEQVRPVTGFTPSAEEMSKDAGVKRAMEYMGLEPGVRMEEIKVDKVFVGSCTNGRIEDLRLIAELVRGEKVSKEVKLAMVVPGSGLVKRQAEEEGIAAVLEEAGFAWRAPGCSMCLGMNEDQLLPGERCASTSNRNFEGRQGKGGRTHLVSPAMAAAAAITGRLADVRKMRNFARIDSRGFGTTSEGDAAPFWKKRFVSRAAPLDMRNVDTDMIIPAKHLKTIKRTGLGQFCFSELRERPDFVLSRPEFRSAGVLLAGENFGCGSSREHAPWALKDMGFSCVIAPSFADIFFNNCFKNGMLPITLDEGVVKEMMDAAKDGKLEVEVRLGEQEIVTRRDGAEKTVKFEVDEFRKHCLLNGLDDIGLTLQKVDLIEKYEKQREARHSWF